MRGAMIFLEKLGRPTVGMRVGRVLGMYSPDDLAPHFDAVIEPANWSKEKSMEPIDEKILRTTAEICGPHSAAAQAIRDAESKRAAGRDVQFFKAANSIVVASSDPAQT